MKRGISPATADRPPRLHPLVELTRTRFLRFVREPESVFWVFIFPLLLALVLGIAFQRRGEQPVPVGLVAGPGADGLAQRLAQAPGLAVKRYRDAEEGRRKLLTGAVAALVLPGSPPLVRYDPARTEGALAWHRVATALSQTPPPALRRETVRETGSRYIDFLLPGLLGMNLMGTGVWGIGFGVVTDRQRRLLKRLLVTPMRRAHFLFSFVLSRLLFLALEILVIVVFGVAVLAVPFRGDVLSFIGLVLLGTFAFTGLGLLLASRVRTVEGISGLANATLMPMWLLCGTFFSYERFPEAVQPLIRLLPLTALNDALRAHMLEGVGPAHWAGEAAVLAVWAALTFALALRLFRWE